MAPAEGELRERLQRALGSAYRLERELGGGGMARVFVAEEVALGRLVVVKVLAPAVAEGLSAERFAREVRIAAGLQHPHIVPLLATGGDGELLYYTMPFVAGESLAHRLEQQRQLPVDEAVRIARETAEALQHAHEHGVVHRDVKPGNILLSGGHATVADFGIARAVGAAASDRLTASGVSLGTPAYMSPEQAVGDEADERSDVYSLACVLYEMLAGEPPFTGPTMHAVVAKRLAGPPPRVSVVRPTVPPALEAALLAALAPVPADRPPSAIAFARSLELAMSGTVPTVPRRAAPSRQLVAALALAVLLAGAATLALFLRRDGDTPVSRTRLAVLPFAVQGGGEHTAHLAAGMVDLLSRDLDGLQEIRAVDPSVVITRAKRLAKSGELDADRQRVLARQLGAGLYVTGGVTMLGARLRMQAELFEQDTAAAAAPTGAEAPEPLARASVEGDTAEIFELVDRLAADLLARRYRGPGGRIVRTAAATTRSLPALRAYLEAEAHLRDARFDSAAVDYRSATVADSTFALAHYRLAVAEGLQGRWREAATAARRALAFADRLSDRDRRLLAAYDAFVRGDADRAEAAYRAVLADYPDDLEARFLLGRTLAVFNPQRGRSMMEARPVFDEVRALDPEFLCPI